jgi:NitT/TauT family transport system substrate-binding protein
MRLRLHQLLAAATAVCLGVATAVAAPVRIGVPEKDNIQYLSLWVALGGGFFQAEGLEVEVVYSEAANLSAGLLTQNRADVALLQPPIYLGMIAQQIPIVLFANLLANDPINLVVRADVAAKIKLNPSAPLRERLRALKGLRVGVAPEPVRRLRMLYAHAGMDADTDLKITTLRADEHTAAFVAGSVDALYTHTPFLEDLLVGHGTVMVANQSSGEVAPLSNGQIHSLAAMKTYAQAHPEIIAAVTRAIARAQALLSQDATAAAQALAKAGIPAPTPKHLATIVDLYRGAVPATPEVSAAAIERNVTLYPGRPSLPDFSKVRAADYLLNSSPPKHD